MLPLCLLASLLAASSCAAPFDIELFSEVPCRSNPDRLCRPPAGACSSANFTVSSNAACALLCMQTTCCAGFEFNDRFCRLALGFCTQKIMRKNSPLVPRSCEEIARCAQVFQNGPYNFTFGAFANSTMAFYCNGMNTATARTFVNLTEENYSYYGGTIYSWVKTKPLKRTFTKIAINPRTLEVYRSEYAFASPNTPSKEITAFAESGSCKNQRGFGKMVVNLRGTPFHIHPLVKWIPRDWKPRMKNYRMSSDRKYVTLECDGACGNCRPYFNGSSKPKLFLELD